MKVLYHHRTQAEDGQAVHIRSLIRAFESLGHEVREVGLVKQREGSARPATEADGRSKWSWVTRLPRFARELAEYGYNGVARSKLLGEARDFDPALIYERYAFGNAAGVLAARKLDLPLVLEVNSPLVLELSKTRGLAFPRLATSLENYIFRHATLVCVVTGVLRDMLLELGVEPSRVFVTPNGVHPELYRRGADARLRARAALGLREDDDGEVLGFVGYYRTWHRLDRAVRALAEPELARARLVLVGEGPAHDELVEVARKAGVAERVHFAGRRAHDEIPELLAAFDIALVPAINPYASPLKLHEYMAAGVATIAPDQPNLREVLAHERNALLVDPDDDDALGAAIARLARDTGLRLRLAEAGRRTILEDDLTWTGNVRRVLAAVAELERAPTA
ncbi:MAG: glycosyltransferase family 4 protein [Planctomycetota bacterium]